ncbi:MAG: hypothetical protein RIM72_06690 [Alphaproteobacteria bacterium]
MRTLVLQSHEPARLDGWIGLCCNTVKTWAAQHDFDYRFTGNEAFDLLPGWYRDKTKARPPVAADLARLLLARDALAGGDYQRVVWCDADVLVLSAEAFTLPQGEPACFGQEIWVEADKQGKLRARRNIHNAICCFEMDGPVLPFLIHTTQRIIERVDPAFIAPQIVGPKLIGALHNLAGFGVIEQAGALSPAVIDAVLAGGGMALDILKRESPVMPAAVNLCASLAGNRSDAEMRVLCQRLLADGL